ncbi:MAG: hypothetical protein LBJ36_09415, partial [Synergistaceae bacterium]|nr:hypothetical protein [Synergistaceae bacterium]
MMKRIIKIGCGFIMIILFYQNLAYADIIVAPNPTPSRIYVGPDPYYQLGQALGDLFGTAMQNSNERAAQKEKEK